MDNTITFTISDDGIGLNEETQKNIFDKYYTTKQGEGGSGLGLYIVKKLVNNYYSEDNYVIIFSGRDSICQELTVEWLIENEIWYDNLLMRPKGNNEKDAIIKRRMFEENIRGKYIVEYVLDDRNQVVEMWRSLGLICLQVADGNF